MYFIELILTRKCNQFCDYCTTNLPNFSGRPEVDLDYLRYVLNSLPDETGVELTGGEIGLINNIDEVFKMVYDHSNIKHIIALSNGLLRLREVDWLDKVEYWEHLVHRIRGKNIDKFYPELDFNENYKNIIVTSYSTTKSLIENWEYFDALGMFRPHFYYKLLNHKSKNIDLTKHQLDELYELFGKLNYKYALSMLLTMNLKNYLKEEKRLCQLYSPNSFIDFESRLLGHCAINVNLSDKWNFNKNNLENLIYGNQFKEYDYCKTCHSFDYGKNRGPLNNRSYKR